MEDEAISTEPVDTTIETPETPSVVEPDIEGTFDAEYVRALRAEAADSRVKAKAAHEEANVRILRASIERDGRLVDPDALPFVDGLLDDDGWIDPAKVAESITELVTVKPYLASARPRTVIPQGIRETPPDPPSLTALIQARM